MVIVSGIVCVYYNIIVTWTLYYLFNSLRQTLPWSHCDNFWNSDNCTVTKKKHSNINNTFLANFSSTLPILRSNDTEITANLLDRETVAELSNSTKISPSEEFWQ